MEKADLKILQEWHELYKSGVITEAEFMAKKKELLGETLETTENVSSSTPEVVSSPQERSIQTNEPEVHLPRGEHPVSSHSEKSDIPEFLTEPIYQESEENERQHPGRLYWIIIPIVLLILVGGGYLYYKKGNDKRNEESIREFIAAEQSRNFDAIYSFFSQNMIRYWDLYNPSEQQLEEKYTYVWRITPFSNNQIEKIEKVGNNTYDLYTNFSFRNRKGRFKSSLSRVRFVFDKNGKIIESYGM